MRRYCIYNGEGEQIGGPFDSKPAAELAADLLKKEAGGEYEADTFPRGRE